MFRNAICWVMIAVTPSVLVAADSGGAILYGRGPVWLNGKPLPRSSAVFPGDLIQTQAESLANLDAPGSGVIVLPDSLVRVEANAVSLERGSVSVATSHRMVATAREVVVAPAADKWTEFEVVDGDGTVQVIASKGELNVNCGKGTVNLSEGEQVTRDESGNCKKKRRKVGGAPLPGHGGILTDPYVLGGGLGGGVIACLLLCTSSKPFVSQWKP
jgi:hypothetical protein